MPDIHLHFHSPTRGSPAAIAEGRVPARGESSLPLSVIAHRSDRLAPTATSTNSSGPYSNRKGHSTLSFSPEGAGSIRAGAAEAISPAGDAWHALACSEEGEEEEWQEEEEEQPLIAATPAAASMLPPEVERGQLATATWEEGGACTQEPWHVDLHLDSGQPCSVHLFIPIPAPRASSSPGQRRGSPVPAPRASSSPDQRRGSPVPAPRASSSPGQGRGSPVPAPRAASSPDQWRASLPSERNLVALPPSEPVHAGLRRNSPDPTAHRLADPSAGTSGNGNAVDSSKMISRPPAGLPSSPGTGSPSLLGRGRVAGQSSYSPERPVVPAVTQLPSSQCPGTQKGCQQRRRGLPPSGAGQERFTGSGKHRAGWKACGTSNQCWSHRRHWAGHSGSRGQRRA